MRCTVFGGGGFVGSAIADRLLAQGHAVRIFERPRVAKYRAFDHSERMEWVTGDFSSSHDMAGALEGADAVIHLVSATLPKSSNDDPIFDVQGNVISTLQMLNEMVAQNIRRIVFISSGGTVYGSPVYLPIDELHPTNPEVSYGITKLAIEKYLLLFQKMHGIKATILRVANPFGERQRIETAQGAVAVFLHRALNGLPIDIWGDGSVTRDYIYVKDVADAFAAALAYEGSVSTFNVGSGQGTSLSELLASISDIVGVPVETRFLPGRPFDVKTSVLSNALAQSELGWTPKFALRPGLRMTADWFRRHLAADE